MDQFIYAVACYVVDKVLLETRTEAKLLPDIGEEMESLEYQKLLEDTTEKRIKYMSTLIDRFDSQTKEVSARVEQWRSREIKKVSLMLKRNIHSTKEGPAVSQAWMDKVYDVALTDIKSL